MKAIFRIVDKKALFQVLTHPLLFLKMRISVLKIIYGPSSPVQFLIYSDKRSLERLSLKPGRYVPVWRTWKDGSHYIGICFGLSLVRKTLMHNVFHEIGHVICYDSNHRSHIVSPKILNQVNEIVKKREIIYRQALNKLFISFPLLRKFEHMCESIKIEDILKEFYANDIIIKYCDPEERIEGLTEEAEELCQGLSSIIQDMPIFFTNPLTVLNTVLVSIVSESSAIRLTKQANYLKNKLNQSQKMLDEFYIVFPSEAYSLRKKLVPFFSDLNETPSSSDIGEYIFRLQDNILTFYDDYSWWLKIVEDMC